MLKLEFQSKLILTAIIFIVGIFTAYIIIMPGKRQPSKNKLEEINGLLYRGGSETPLTGEVLDTVNNKIVKYEVVKGIKRGRFSIFSLSGQVEIEGKVIDNKNEGNWKYYYPSGKLESTGDFKNDLPMGEWTWYHENGTVKEKGVFANGKKEGIWHSYNIYGDIEKIIMYSRGEVINEVKKPDLRIS